MAKSETGRALDRALFREKVKVAVLIALGSAAVVVVLGVLQLRRPVPEGHVLGEVVSFEEPGGTGSGLVLVVRVDGAEQRIRHVPAGAGVAPGDAICLLRLRVPSSGRMTYDRAPEGRCGG